MFQLQIKRRGQTWRTIKEDAVPANVVVQMLAYHAHNIGYPVFRVLMPHGSVGLETTVDGHLNILHKGLGEEVRKINQLMRGLNGSGAAPANSKSTP